MEWQPIETAPNSVEVLVYSNEIGCALLAQKTCLGELFSDQEQDQHEKEFGPFENDDWLWDSDWFYADFLTGGRLNILPTHWMPLPAPPTASDQDQSTD